MSETQYDDVNVANTSKEQKMNVDNLENVIRYSLMPSLQYISIVSIMIALWRRADFHQQLVDLFYKYKYRHDVSETCVLEMRQEIGVKVLDGLAQLPVPNLIRKIFSNIVDPIGEEIYNWMRFHESIFSDGSTGPISLKPTAISCMDYLVWTSRGRIDYKSTAKSLLDHMQLSNYDQYDLACTYCLVDDIAIIAPKVVDTLVLNDIGTQPMLYFWTSNITGDFSELDRAVTPYIAEERTGYTTNECVLDILFYDTINETAIKYIWDKLNHEEKSRQCVSVITQFSSIDLYCFIVSQLNEEQQQRVFKACSSRILLSLLGDWLWGTYFSHTLYHIWNVMTEGHYIGVLEGIVDKMEEINPDIEKYDRYRSAFKELWQSAPARLKGYVLDNLNGYRCHHMFFRLFCEKNVDIIQSILFDCNYTQKQNIIFSENCRYSCHLLINEQYGLLETLIEHTLVSEGDGDSCKQKFVKESREFISYFMENGKWNEKEQNEKWAFKSYEDIEQFCEALTTGICRNTIKAFVLRYKGDCTQLEHLLYW